MEVSRKLRSLPADSGMAVGSMALLLAAVVTGSALAASMVSSGKVSVEQLGLASQSAVRDVSSGLEQRGSVFALTNGTNIHTVVFEVVSSTGGGPVSLDAAQDETMVTYIDDSTIIRDVAYQVNWVSGDGDALLEPRETAEVRVDVSGIPVSDRFTLEMRPLHGVWVALELDGPSGNNLDQVIRLQ